MALAGFSQSSFFCESNLHGLDYYSSPSSSPPPFFGLMEDNNCYNMVTLEDCMDPFVNYPPPPSLINLPTLSDPSSSSSGGFDIATTNSPTSESHQSCLNFESTTPGCNNNNNFSTYPSSSMLSFDHLEVNSLLAATATNLFEPNSMVNNIDQNSLVPSSGYGLYGVGGAPVAESSFLGGEKQFRWLYSETNDDEMTFQESEGLLGSIHKRSYMGGEVQVSKRQCVGIIGSPDSKSTASKDPQSIAAKNRREKISERLKILQDLVPNGTKVDMVTMLEKAISYVKFLQLQVKVLATDEFWPAQGGKAPEIGQVKEAIDAILSSHKESSSSK